MKSFNDIMRDLNKEDKKTDKFSKLMLSTAKNKSIPKAQLPHAKYSSSHSTMLYNSVSRQTKKTDDNWTNTLRKKYPGL